MFNGIVTKELVSGIYGYKFLLTLLLAFATIPLSLYLGAERYGLELEQARTANRTSMDHFRSQTPKPPRNAAFFELYITKPPPPLLAFTSGIHEALGTRAEIDYRKYPELTGNTTQRSPLHDLFGNLDYVFLVHVVFGLLAFVLSFDLISGEREDGTLELILANSVSRGSVLLAKGLGGSLVLLVPVTLASLVGLLFLTPLFGFQLSLDEWLRALGIVGLSLVYLLMMFAIGLFVSVVTHRRITSMIALLVVWVVMIFLVPRFASILAQEIQPLPSTQEVAGRERNIIDEERERFQARNREFVRQNLQYDFDNFPREVLERHRQEADEAVDRRIAQYRQNVEAIQARQIALAANFSRMSPASAYLMASSELAGTGIYRHRRFVRQMLEYRERFRGYFDRLIQTGGERVEDFGEVPELSFREGGLEEVLPRILVDGALLLTVILLLFGLSHALFRKADVQ